MGLTVYGPDEPWPRHQKQHWREALKQARDAGWTLHHLGAPHRFGIVKCPEGEHTFAVGSTARNSETHARQVPKRLRACRHGSTRLTRPAAREAECTKLLDRADELIRRASDDLCLAQALTMARADCDAIESMLDSADANLDEVVALHDDASARVVELEDAPGAHDIAETLDDAADAIEAAAGLAGKVRRAAAVASVKGRIEAAKQQVARLRRELELI